jgi:hypothetical protein
MDFVSLLNFNPFTIMVFLLNLVVFGIRLLKLKVFSNYYFNPSF